MAIMEAESGTEEKWAQTLGEAEGGGRDKKSSQTSTKGCCRSCIKPEVKCPG